MRSCRGPYQYCDSETKSAQGLSLGRENFSLTDLREAQQHQQGSTDFEP